MTMQTPIRGSVYVAIPCIFLVCMGLAASARSEQPHTEQSVQITQIVPTQGAVVAGVLSNDDMPSFLIWNLCLESLELKTLVEIDKAEVPRASPSLYPWCHPDNPVWRSSYVFPWYARLWLRFQSSALWQRFHGGNLLIYRYQGSVSHGLNAEGDVVQLTDSSYDSGRFIGAIPGTKFLLLLRPLVEDSSIGFENQPSHGYILLDNRDFSEVDRALFTHAFPSDESFVLLHMVRAVSPAFGSDNNLVLIRERNYSEYRHSAYRLLRLSPFEELVYVSRAATPAGVNRFGRRIRSDGWPYGLFSDDCPMSVREYREVYGMHESIRYTFEQDDDGEIARFAMESLERSYVDPRVDSFLDLWERRDPLDFAVYNDSRDTLHVVGLDPMGNALKTHIEIDPLPRDPIDRFAIGLDGRWFATLHEEGRIALWDVDFPNVRHLSTHTIVYRLDSEEMLRLERTDDIEHTVESAPIESFR